MAIKKKSILNKSAKKIDKKEVKRPLKKMGKQPTKKATKKITVKVKTKKVSAIPKGYHTITSYLIVANAAKAIDFYKKVFTAKEVMRLEQPNGKIMHAELKIGDAKFMLSDPCSETKEAGSINNKSFSAGIHLYVKKVDEIVNAAVKAGAKLLKSPQDMFYGDRCAAIEDPYGHHWTIATHIEDVSTAKTKKRVAELFSKKSQ